MAECYWCGHHPEICGNSEDKDNCDHYYHRVVMKNDLIDRPATDPAVSPPHYKTPSGLEAIDVIEAFSLGYRLGNVVKYVLRAGKKGEALRDLKKAAWYLGRQIEKMEQETGGPK